MIERILRAQFGLSFSEAELLEDVAMKMKSVTLSELDDITGVVSIK